MEHELFQSFCDALPLGVCLVDREGKIIYWNAAAEGSPAITATRSWDGAYRGVLLGVRNDTAAGGWSECPVRAVLRDGRAVAADLFLRHKAVHVNAFPLRDDEGELRGVAEVLDGSPCKQELAPRAGLGERECELPLGLPALTDSREHQALCYASATISAMRSFHSRGPVSCTEVPLLSTATVTGMSRTSNS